MRLELEPMLRAHAAELHPILSDPRLYEFTGGEPPTSVESLAEIYASRESRLSPDGSEIWLNWVIRLREPRDAVGYAQATISSTHADVAWVVGTRWQGCGYASETAMHLVDWLRTLGVTRVRACVNPRHVASQKVARSAGLSRIPEMIDGEEVWEIDLQRESGLYPEMN